MVAVMLSSRWGGPRRRRRHIELCRIAEGAFARWERAPALGSLESKYPVVSKMMAAMGYRPDRGLGKDAPGIVAPMEGTLRPGHAGLGSVKEPKPLFSGRENLAPALAQKELGQPRWSKKASKRKDPVLTKNALLAEDERAMGVQKVIDMGGLQVRVLTGLRGLNDGQDMEVDDDMPMPELQHNLRVLVDMPWTDIRRLDAHLKGHYDDVSELCNAFGSRRLQWNEQIRHSYQCHMVR